MIVATLVIQAMTALALAYAIVCSRATTWYCEQATLYRTNPEQARRRKVNPPPSVRVHGAVSRALKARR